METLRKAECLHKKVELWCMDEHRIGLQPISTRAWSKRGERLVRKVNIKYEWLYIYAFACPQTGESNLWITNALDSKMYQEVLRKFRNSIPQDIHVLMVEDQAGFHQQPEDAIKNLEIISLPSYSPELQPCERLWKLTDAPIFNKCFESIQEVHRLLSDRCDWLEKQRDLITRQTLFHWWPLTVNGRDP